MIVKNCLNHKKPFAIGGVVLAILLTFSPMVYRTWAFGSDAWVLTVIALLDPQEVPWSPFDRDSLVIRPSLAYWLLTHFNWPYERCGRAMSAMGGCSQPLVNLVGASLGTHGADSIMERRGYSLFRHFAARGESVNGYHRGFAPVHEAVLYANVDYLSALLELGANPDLPIRRPEKQYDDFNAYEFAELLESRDPEMFRDVRAELESS